LSLAAPPPIWPLLCHHRFQGWPEPITRLATLQPEPNMLGWHDALCIVWDDGACLGCVVVAHHHVSGCRRAPIAKIVDLSYNILITVQISRIVWWQCNLHDLCHNSSLWGWACVGCVVVAHYHVSGCRRAPIAKIVDLAYNTLIIVQISRIVWWQCNLHDLCRNSSLFGCMFE
jgi:hypothetical protein